jgi:hypothetical protein
METQEMLCDSSSLISMTDSCLDGLLHFLNSKFGVRFIIPASVAYETISRPLDSHLRQYSYSALKIKRAIMQKTIICMPKDSESAKDTDEVLRTANNMFFVKGKPLRLVHLGEAEMLALAKELDIQNILIDERTTRMLVESPFRLKEHLEHEFGVNIMVSRESLTTFSDMTKGFEAIRSSELALLGYENGFFDSYEDLKLDMVEAALYKLKFSGCSIRFDEISDYVNSLRGQNGTAVPGK